MAKNHNPYGYFDKALNRFFSTNRSKREYMKSHGIVENGSMESEKKRDNRNADIINETRRKQGLKPKTLQELAGDARKVKTTKYFIM